MIKQGIDRLEGIDKNEIVEALIDVIESAEIMGDTVKCFLEKTETRQAVSEAHQTWESQLTIFYNKYIA
ncbi:MAG: hypothetical protein HOD92_01195 [Deltaproteobacteria bacterium]|jgi:hypothetical protein|nr:hypothetical protein [Deltaproteobacteria bacterium]MBT4526139.1 hypothetical protein [Deltaproteobacteria bacterium]